MNYFLIFCFAIISNVFFAQNKAEKYSGFGIQVDHQTWKIEVQKNNNGSYKINYPDIPCSSVWKVAENLKDIYPVEEGVNYSIAQEKLTTGKDKCMDNSWVLLVDEKLSKTAKRFYIFETEHDSKPYAYGFLELEKEE